MRGGCSGFGSFVHHLHELTAVGAFPLRSLSQFSNRCTTTKNVGTNSTARQVEAIMPENTVMPIDLRALALAPVASTSGPTPRMKANDVIRIGRNRARAASIADSNSGLGAPPRGLGVTA